MKHELKDWEGMIGNLVYAEIDTALGDKAESTSIEEDMDNICNILDKYKDKIKKVVVDTPFSRIIVFKDSSFFRFEESDDGYDISSGEFFEGSGPTIQ